MHQGKKGSSSLFPKRLCARQFFFPYSFARINKRRLRKSLEQATILQGAHLVLNWKREIIRFLPEVCLRGLCVCLTSDETPASFEHSDRCAGKSKRRDTTVT